MSMEGHAPAFEGLLYTVFQQLRESQAAGGGGAGRGLAVAFTSANAGEGVSHTIGALVAGLAREPGTRALVADSRVLREMTAEPAEVPALCRPLSSAADTLFELRALGPGRGSHSWEGSWQYRRDCVEALRGGFDYILLDCPAMRESNDLLSLAPFADGVILVVEADRTRKDQVLYAEKAIEFARGRLIGHILNKRAYVVPEWIYRRL